MKKILFTVAIATLPVAALAETEFTVSMVTPTSEQVDKHGQEYKLSYGGNVYGWASYSGFDQTMVTQRPNSLDVYGLGVGFKSAVTEKMSLYFDAGVGFNRVDSRNEEPPHGHNPLKESIYYTFHETFGEPSFQTEGMNIYKDLEYRQTIEEYAPLARVGLKYDLNDRFSVHASYMWHKVEQFIEMSTELDRWESEPDCDCLWHGFTNIDMSNFQVGVSVRF